MLLPHRYRLRATLHAVDAKERHGFVLLPQGAMVTVTEQPDGNHLLAVNWEGRELILFAQDLINAADPTDPERGRH